MSDKSGIQQACDKLGGQISLAEALGVSQQAVSRWVRQGFAPTERVPRIAELADLPKRDLCDPSLVDLING